MLTFIKGTISRRNENKLKHDRNFENYKRYGFPYNINQICKHEIRNDGCILTSSIFVTVF